MRREWWAWLLVACALLGGSGARADDVAVAVAANFVGTLQKLAASFARETGHALRISPGSSGQLYAQIKAGAPYEVLLSADSQRPQALEREGLGVRATRFVYARGRLALWSKRAGLVDAQGQLLKRGALAKLGIADPRTAPYGAAAQQVLERLGLWDALKAQHKIAIGESVAQAYQFAASGNADCAFVAYAQVLGGAPGGSFWLVPETLHAALNQEAILLKPGEGKPAARAFLSWLEHSRAARTALRAAGYGLPAP
jgi:molybdate transport system substrate-binding protein